MNNNDQYNEDIQKESIDRENDEHIEESSPSLYKDLIQKKIDICTSKLESHGITEGDPIAAVLRNTIDVIYYEYAANKKGTKIDLFNINENTKKIIDLFTRDYYKLLIIDPIKYEEITSLTTDKKLLDKIIVADLFNSINLQADDKAEKHL